jgi:hypothetical protein
MAAFAVSMATSIVEVSDSVQFNDEDTARIATGQTAAPGITDCAAMLDYPEYWIG